MSLTVYGDIWSGNCYKVKLLLCRLGLAHNWQHVDILQGESRTPAFLALNPNSHVFLMFVVIFQLFSCFFYFVLFFFTLVMSVRVLDHTSFAKVSCKGVL